MAGDDLFDDVEEDLGPFADAAALGERDRAAAGRDPRGPGRPKGALNRKTRDFERWYQANGWADPLAAMARYLTADPRDLQAWFIEHERAEVAVGKEIRRACPTLMEILKEQHTVASQIAPYLHGKKPVQLEIIDERLPTLIVDLGTNQLEEGETIAGRKALSVGRRPEGEPSEINDLADPGEESHTKESHTDDASN